MALVVATAPAAAAEEEFLKPLGWYPEESTLRSGVPTSVKFHDVAAAGAAVVAVGTNTATGAPVIYSRGGSGWRPDPVDPPLPAAGELTDVVLGDSGGTGWAVGKTAAGQPLVLELAPGVWKEHSAKLGLTNAATAVTLNSGSAIVGDSAGSLHWVGSGGTLMYSRSLNGAAAINGITLFERSPGLAVADYEPLVGEPDNNSVRIYDLHDPPLLDADEQARAAGVSMKGLAAVAANHAVAIDSTPATWRLTRAFDRNDWIQDGAPDGASRLDGVASVLKGPPPWDGDGWATEFVTGEAGTEGAIWQRTRWTKDFATWNRATLPAGTRALSGVAATEWDAAWAVGDGATILRYWRPPDPEAEAAWLAAQQQEQEQQEQEGTQDPTVGETQPQEQTQEEQQTSTVTLKQWDPSDSPLEPGEDRILTNGVVVTDGEGTVPRRKRLVKNVKAIFRRELSGRRKLIVKFRLTRRANVRVAAKRGRRVIARTRLRTMGRGRRKVVLRIRGKTPPTSLKIVARPARKAT